MGARRSSSYYGVAFLYSASGVAYLELGAVGCAHMPKPFLLPTTRKLVFAYLAVLPQALVLAADANCPPEQSVQMRVESVRCGDLQAKLQSTARGGGVGSWRVLCGFYVDQKAWRSTVRAAWQAAAMRGSWEHALREGLRLACVHARRKSVFVKSSARSNPVSPLLQALQTFTVRRGATKLRGERAVSLRREFWQLVSGNQSLVCICPRLTHLTRSWNALAVSAQTPHDARGAPTTSPTTSFAPPMPPSARVETAPAARWTGSVPTSPELMLL